MADSLVGLIGNSLTRLDPMLEYGFTRLARENPEAMTPEAAAFYLQARPVFGRADAFPKKHSTDRTFRTPDRSSLSQRDWTAASRPEGTRFGWGGAVLEQPPRRSPI